MNIGCFGVGYPLFSPPESRCEIVEENEREVSFITFNGERVTKKVVAHDRAHSLGLGFFNYYSFDDGKEMSVFEVRELDWRTWEAPDLFISEEALDKARKCIARGLEKLGKYRESLAKPGKTPPVPLAYAIRHQHVTKNERNHKDSQG